MKAPAAASSTACILHETARRLRLRLAMGADATALRAALKQLPGVASVRINGALQCVVVLHDGRPETRAAVLQQLSTPRPTPYVVRPPRGSSKVAEPHLLESAGATDKPQRRPAPAPAPAAIAGVSAWMPALLAASLPVLPQTWRRGAALAVVATRVLSQPARLRSDAPAVLLDAASLAALAINGQPLVVATSVLLRLLSERLSARGVRQADGLLDHLLPTAAASYTALRGPDDGSSGWAWWPLRALRAGDRVRLFPGDVVPVDGCVVDGSATLAPAAEPAANRADARQVRLGEHLAAGERLQDGTLELRAEADAASSRLERLRAQVRHAIGSRDPAGRLAPDLGRLLSLPLTAATLVFGLTGDSARAAAMLQADPQQGLDLALPVGREAALYALARHGLITAGLEAIERLATARVLVLQDTGVMATGRWTIEAVHTESGGDAPRVRGWIAALAGTPVEALDEASFPDSTVRQWVRHGAVLRVGTHEVHLASRQRLQQVWALQGTAGIESRTPAAAPARLRRELAVVATGRVVAWVVLASALRPELAERLRELSALGFERMALFSEAAGGKVDVKVAVGDRPPAASSDLGRLRQIEPVADDAAARADWLADAVQDGTPLVLVHTVLRDLVPAGSLSLSPVDGDAGSHGILLGDPLQSLVAARCIAQRVHHRLRLQQGTAVAANAALMTAAALRWLPPIAITLLHHGHALLLLLDSLRIESLAVPQGPQGPQRLAPHRTATRRARTVETVETVPARSEPP